MKIIFEKNIDKLQNRFLLLVFLDLVWRSSLVAVLLYFKCSLFTMSCDVPRSRIWSISNHESIGNISDLARDSMKIISRFGEVSAF